MELLCLEQLAGDPEGGPHLDRVVYQDSRVLQNLLCRERRHHPLNDYFTKVQDRVRPYMRRILTYWMLEVCEHEGCEDQVLPLAIHYLDRFLAVCRILPEQLQLTGCVCLLIASKIRECRALTPHHLVYYSNKTVTLDLLKGWELLVVTKLHWQLAGVTAYDFVDQLIQRLSYLPHGLLRSHAVTLLALAYTELSLMQTRSSVLACAAIVAAARGLRLQPDLLQELCFLCKADPPTVENVVTIIEQRFAEEEIQEPPSMDIF